MKNKYIKPVFAVELFSGAQSTTRDCMDSINKDQVTLNDLPDCYYEPAPGFILFQTGIATSCVVNGEGFDAMCYNNPGEGQYIFRS